MSLNAITGTGAAENTGNVRISAAVFVIPIVAPGVGNVPGA